MSSGEIHQVESDGIKEKIITILTWNYLHLPAKWLGGRKPLGWAAGPYGEGAGWPEPIEAEGTIRLFTSNHTVASSVISSGWASGPQFVDFSPHGP